MARARVTSSFCGWMAVNNSSFRSFCLSSQAVEGVVVGPPDLLMVSAWRVSKSLAAEARTALNSDFSNSLPDLCRSRTAGGRSVSAAGTPAATARARERASRRDTG